jgi:hypothetical protein
MRFVGVVSQVQSPQIIRGGSRVVFRPMVNLSTVMHNVLVGITVTSRNPARLGVYATSVVRFTS